MKPEPTASSDLALDFARALDAGDFARAHTMLSTALQAELTAEQLGAAYTEMVSYGEGRATVIQVMETMDAWPDKRPGDTQWVYVAIGNGTYSEAVTLVIAEQQSRLAVRSIEWGRP